jgi:hypothetical protein
VRCVCGDDTQFEIGVCISHQCLGAGPVCADNCHEHGGLQLFCDIVPIAERDVFTQINPDLNRRQLNEVADMLVRGQGWVDAYQLASEALGPSARNLSTGSFWVVREPGGNCFEMELERAGDTLAYAGVRRVISRIGECPISLERRLAEFEESIARAEWDSDQCPAAHRNLREVLAFSEEDGGALAARRRYEAQCGAYPNPSLHRLR